MLELATYLVPFRSLSLLGPDGGNVILPRLVESASGIVFLYQRNNNDNNNEHDTEAGRVKMYATRC
jgi:hypothetical protein